MAREYNQAKKEILKCIPKIYKRNAENIMLFSWVNAQRQIVPPITLEQAIRNYFKFNGIEDWDMESARTTYCRLQKEFYEDCRE